MSVVPVVLQRADVTIPTGELFPIYTGFMTPVEILKVSEVPSYDGWRYDDAQKSCSILPRQDLERDLVVTCGPIK